jgi:hypothetical protein
MTTSRTGLVSFVSSLALALAIAGTLAAPAAGVAGTVTIGIDATVDSSGNTTLVVTAAGCGITPTADFPEIVVQTRDPVSGATGEGAVAVGGFTAPGQGSVVIPAGTPGDSFLLTVHCNGGALHGEQPFTLAAPVGGPPTPVSAPPSFTG